MKRAVVLAAVATLLLAGLSPAEAAIVKKWSVGVSAHGGFEKVDKNADWNDTLITGARLALSINPAFQVEASYDSFSTDSDDSDSPISDVTVDFTGLRFVGTFFAQEDMKVMPYVAVGVGIQDTKLEFSDGSDTITDDGTYGELSFGARVFLWRQLHIRAEAGFRQSRTVDVTQTNTHVTVGLAYLFGGVE